MLSLLCVRIGVERVCLELLRVLHHRAPLGGVGSLGVERLAG